MIAVTPELRNLLSRRFELIGKIPSLDPMYSMAELSAGEFFRISSISEKGKLPGALSSGEVSAKVHELRQLGVDAYVQAVVSPSEDPRRMGAQSVIRRLGVCVLHEIDMGPLYAAQVVFEFPGGCKRHIGVLAQERRRRNGVWLPEHHLAAVEIIRGYASRALPIVTFMDTPGADAGQAANRQNQAHCISRLIAEFAQLEVPTVGVILGNGYSGGAIPLAATNLLLSVRDGVFNTIQPRGLASIARKYNLSWQECAFSVGVSSYELCSQGIVDAIVDFVPGEMQNLPNLASAIIHGILAVERDAQNFVRSTPEVFGQYQRSVCQYLDPSERLQKLQDSGLSLPVYPSEQLNVFGCAFRHLRYREMRGRLHSTTLSQYGRLSPADVPRGDLRLRNAEEHERIFRNWVDHPLEIRYDEELAHAWRRYLRRQADLSGNYGRLHRALFGDPQSNFRKASRDLMLIFGLHLLNQWKGAAQNNFLSLARHLQETPSLDASKIANPTVLDILRHQDIHPLFPRECGNFLLFDLIYNRLLADMREIAHEIKERNVIERESIGRLFEQSLKKAARELTESGCDAFLGEDWHAQLMPRFMAWADHFARRSRKRPMLKKIEEWKKLVHPRISEPLFAVATFYFEHLLPSYFEFMRTGRPYDGRLTPRNIGIRDFWNRMAEAYQDLLINEELQKLKQESPITASRLIERFFSDFQETDRDLMTADPVRFPGFRASIEETLAKGGSACGTITGIGTLKCGPRVSVVISNLEFQAGAFDMASAQKFCRLLVESWRQQLPLIAFISSGGMQTKEGAAALFAMAALNDRITRFVLDAELPIICFGFGDCTGGAQASFVTHPLVQTYYFSGTNMPFAGQIVVPEHLPCSSTLSNYLSREPGSMKGLVQHPFYADLDARLCSIDPAIPAGSETVEAVIERVLRWDLTPATAGDSDDMPAEEWCAGPFKRVLVHARGCAAEKIVKKAQEADLEVVLVQSDADMQSPAASLLDPKRDQLVCIGGNTPSESYLNAMSVIRVAKRTSAQALHPGIGFLSESAAFARLVRAHNIVFIGPPASSMDLMGNKSNAIQTALRLSIPVVPGSHGVMIHPEAAAKEAEQIGYPVIVKAVHGGGGKGIGVVENPQQFLETFRRISLEAQNAFGNGDVYLERFVRSLRHIEVQLLRDTHGNVAVLGLRDCSVQRNNQKIIEESGSVLLPEELQKAVYEYAGRIAGEIGYTGAGTVEFIFDLERQSVYFMEMNTRLQVEHPVTEAVSGVDILAEQFRIAAGVSIATLPVCCDGYAMELRINAERASLDSSGTLIFLPSPGKVTQLNFPEEAGISLIRGVLEGKSVTPFYDSMIFQLIGHAPSRAEVIVKLRNYLDRVEIRGVSTNIPLLKRILEDDVFRAGNYDTRFLEGFTARTDLSALLKEMEVESGVSSLQLSQLSIEGTDELRVLSPTSGVFYRSSMPGEPEFIEPGDIINPQKTLCLLEAMKVFQSLTLESCFPGGASAIGSGKFEMVRVVPENGQNVNMGDLLFIIRPTHNEGDNE
jgi:acetyl/propionyl-CoA carboxylase alpha subunit/acetyl-CoA carboxylase alpha subunit